MMCVLAFGSLGVFSRDRYVLYHVYNNIKPIL